jgi:glycosyltransferase involved in cell wall biosynthesis
VACAPLELPLPVLHGLGNGLRGSDVVQGKGGCARLDGLTHNVALLFFEDLSNFVQDAAWTASRLGHFTALVAGSSWTRDVLLTQPACPRVVLALQGVDTGVFPARMTQPPLSGEFRVFSGGKLEFRKGQDVVIAAFRRLLAAHPGAVLVAAWHTDYPELALALSSAGHVTAPPTELSQERVLQWLAANGVPRTAVRLLGNVGAEAVSRAMAECHVAVFTSRAESGTNLFAAQALASGVPTVLSSGTGHDDLADAFGCGAEVGVEARLCYVLRQGVGYGGDARQGWSEPDVEETAEALARALEASRRGTDASAVAAAARRLGSVERRFPPCQRDITWPGALIKVTAL